MDDHGIGVALSSGGAAGLAHVGVLEVLSEAGIEAKFIAGTSAGAMVGAAYAANQMSGMRDRFLAINRRGVMRLFDPTWSSGGLFGGRRAVDLIQPFIGDQIEDLPRRFAAVATDLIAGTREVIRSGSVSEAVRMSAAIPGVFTPVMRNGRPFVDGALVDPIPVEAARELGATFVIAVSVIPPPYAAPLVSACQTPAPSRFSWQSLRNWWPGAQSPPPSSECVRPLPIEEGGPQSLSMVLARSSVVVQAQIAAARLREQPPDFLIQPDVHSVGTFDFDRSAIAVDAGRRAAEAALPALREALARTANVSARRALMRLVAGRRAA